MATKRAVFAVFYIGAPYGDNETGELISKHFSEDAAIAKRNKLQTQARYYGCNTVIKRLNHETGQYERHIGQDSRLL